MACHPVCRRTELRRTVCRTQRHFSGPSRRYCLSEFRIGEIDAVRRAAIELDHSPPRWFKRASSWVEVRATRDMSSELPVQGHDHSGNELIADALSVHDEHLDFQLREQCGFETDFEYSSLNQPDPSLQSGKSKM